MRTAILLNGAVSKVTGKFDNPGQVYRDGDYINYKAIFNSINTHIIKPNDGIFDFYIHCWNFDLESKLVDIYKPKKYLFEDNNLYKQEILSKLRKCNATDNKFALCSRSLSIKKVVDLLSNDSSYDYVILYRPDIMLWTDIILNKYNPNILTVNSRNVMTNYSGDFHYISNIENIKKFSLRYDLDTPPSGWSVYSHENTSRWMKFIRDTMQVDIDMDDIEAGIDQAPIRYINTESISLSAIKQGYITISQLLEYGFSEEEINSYNVIWGGVEPQ